MRRTIAAVLAAAAVAAGGLALADRFTSFMDPVVAEATQRRAALGTPEDAAGRKLAKALDQALAELARDTSDLSGDLKSAEKAVKRLDAAYPEDAVLVGQFGDAAEAYADAVADGARAIRDEASQKKPSKARDKAMAALDAAEADLEAAAALEDPVARVKEIRKALLRTKPAAKFLVKAADDHGFCEGRLLGEGEHLNTTAGVAVWSAETVETGVAGSGSSAVTTISWWACTDTTLSRHTLTFTGVPAPGVQDLGSGPSGATLVRASGTPGSPLVEVNLTGTIDILVSDGAAGDYAGSFNVSDGGAAYPGNFSVRGAVP